MRKSDIAILFALAALTISGCNSTKKPKKSSSKLESSSVLSTSNGDTSYTSTPTSATASSSQTPATSAGQSSEYISSATFVSSAAGYSSAYPTSSGGASSSAYPTSSGYKSSSTYPTSSGYKSSSAPYISSAQPQQSSTTPMISSGGGWKSSTTPYPSSSSYPVSSGTVKPSTSVSPIIGDTDYSYCQTEYDHGNASGLLSELRNVTKDGQSGSYNNLWKTYKTAYVRSDGCMYDYYSNITNYTPGDDQDGGSHPTENYSYNREHSIPKSWWGGDTTNQGADPFIVVPTDAKINEIRNNYPFGMVSSPTQQSANNYSVLGYPNTSWGYDDGLVFEPNDEVKGDFARIYFYVIAKYKESYSWTAYEGDSCFSDSSTKNFGLTDYAIKLFSYWSNLDPVSDWERSINDAIEPIQNNRNPFIDHPEYANVLWGTNSGYTFYNH